jgi:hypothetical protein
MDAYTLKFEVVVTTTSPDDKPQIIRAIANGIFLADEAEDLKGVTSYSVSHTSTMKEG